MIVNIIDVCVKAEHIDDFINATVENHNHSIQEKGNLRFDVLQSNNDPSRFILYEAYDSFASAAEHKNTQHYAKWRDAVAPWMQQPRIGKSYTIIAPVEVKLWKK